MSEEEITGPEETTPSEENVEQTEVQEATPAAEPETSPEPGTPEYTQAVEKRIGKVKSQQYKAEAERDLYKQRLSDLESTPPATTPSTPESDFAEPEPTETTYDDYNQYIKDLSSWQFRKEQSVYQATTARQDAINNASKLESDFNNMVNKSKILDDHADFYDKMRLVNLVPGIRETVLTSERAPELALHLANNPELMRDLNSLPPLVAARKLGTIEAKFTGKIDKKTVSTAPAPIAPVSTDTSVVSEDNPKDINDWMKKRNEREHAKITQNVEGGKIA